MNQGKAEIPRQQFQSTLPRGERLWCQLRPDTHLNFNPRSREGSDRGGFKCIHTRYYFNPRSREGSDGAKPREIADAFDFNPRSREGSDYLILVSILLIKDFNPRSREGSDERGIGSVDKRKRFQSTLPRGERPCRSCFPCRLPEISIHAPARGATRYHHRQRPSPLISIHAPARGATVSRSDVGPILTFQSTLPRGERRPGGHYSGVGHDFNPRSREGSDATGSR